MSNQVQVTVVKATASDYNASGVARAIDCPAEVINEVFIATENYNEGVVGDCKVGAEVGIEHPVAKERVLKILDATRGLIYIRETLASLSAKCEACCV